MLLEYPFQVMPLEHVIGVSSNGNASIAYGAGYGKGNGLLAYPVGYVALSYVFLLLELTYLITQCLLYFQN